jgi:hypothetical protein
MNAHPFIAARVTPETKNRLRAIAQAHQISESALLKRLLRIPAMMTGYSART